MNVTSQILFYLFSRDHSVLKEEISIADNTISSIRRYDPAEVPDADTLYILTSSDLNTLSEAGTSAFHFFLIVPEGKLPPKKVLSKLKGCNYAATNAVYTTYELLNILLQIFHTLLRQENELLLATMDPARSEDVFRFGYNWFPWEYSIVDLDMHLIFKTDNLHKVLGGEKVDRIPSESLNELILSKEFHNAAKVREPFYQSMTFNELTALGRNILPDGQYAGRVVMFLPKTVKKVPKGAEELFSFYTDCIMETLRRSGQFVSRRQNDPLHLLCRSLFQGEDAAEHAISDVLKRSGWKEDHLFTVISFRFLADSAWEAQLETTLPYLADELEIAWPNSCAVVGKRDISWILNLTLSKMSEDLSGFHQQITSFVRDHVCIAGASSVFTSFSLLPDARKCAVAALEIGSQKHPDFWYFSFDNYRLDYMKESLKDSMSSTFLIHPAINRLKQYDEENQSDLTETLKAYLENGRNMSAAADAIFIHRTTFCRRMDHIKKITGVDLDDPGTVILLELSYQL